MEREPMSPDDRPESSAAAAAQPQPLEWRFAQVFGERAAGEDVQEGNKYNPPRACAARPSSVAPSRDLVRPVAVAEPGFHIRVFHVKKISNANMSNKQSTICNSNKQSANMLAPFFFI